ITTERRSEKVQHTLDKFVEHGLNKSFDTLRIMIIGERQATYKAVNVPAALQFDCDTDILGIAELVKHIEGLDTSRLDELAAIFAEELRDFGEINASASSMREGLQILQKACHRILDALKFLWLANSGDITDLEGRHAGHCLEAIGQTAAHLEP